MGQKFDSIYESVVSRFQCGGFLPGDIVTFRKTYKSADCYKSLPTKVQRELDELVKSGLNIRVTQVGNNLSGTTANNQHKTASSAVITVAGDQGGGRHYGMITVSPDMIDLVEDDYPNTGKVPDQFKRKEKIIIKPEKVVNDPNHITRVTDKGNGKNTPTQLKLAGESIKFTRDNEVIGMLYETMNVGINDMIKMSKSNTKDISTSTSDEDYLASLQQYNDREKVAQRMRAEYENKKNILNKKHRTLFNKLKKINDGWGTEEINPNLTPELQIKVEEIKSQLAKIKKEIYDLFPPTNRDIQAEYDAESRNQLKLAGESTQVKNSMADMANLWESSIK
jgi:hypothetical protein